MAGHPQRHTAGSAPSGGRTRLLCAVSERRPRDDGLQRARSTDHDGIENGREVLGTTRAGVNCPASALSEVGTARIESDYGEIVARTAIEPGVGYLVYVHVDGGAHSLGDPEAPQLASSQQHVPAGSGIAIDIRWQPLDATVAAARVM